MELHTSGEDYLEAVLILSRSCADVRSVDLAEHLGVTPELIDEKIEQFKRQGCTLFV